jgi:PPM family protein phosphatase
MIIVASKVESGGPGQDRLAVERLAERVFIVVADGAGGTGGGGRAAQSVCDAAVEAFRDRSARRGCWDACLRKIDTVLARAGYGGMSTAVVAEIDDGRVFGASVGDSCAWLVSRDGVLDLTERQARKPLLGSGEAEPRAFGPMLFRGRLLVGTDGLFKYAPRTRLTSVVEQGTAEATVVALVDAVRLKDGRLQDDVGVVLCEETG